MFNGVGRGVFELQDRMSQLGIGIVVTQQGYRHRQKLSSARLTSIEFEQAALLLKHKAGEHFGLLFGSGWVRPFQDDLN